MEADQLVEGKVWLELEEIAECRHDGLLARHAVVAEQVVEVDFVTRSRSSTSRVLEATSRSTSRLW